MLESIVLKKLDGYHRPFKTKQLAGRLGIDRPRMAKVLNNLYAKNLIAWHHPKRNDDKQYVGWIRKRS